VLDPGGQPPDRSLEHAQAPLGGVLVGSFVEELETDADAEEGHAAVDGRGDGAVEATGPEGLGTAAERPHPGEHHPVGRGRPVRVVDQRGIGPEVLERLLGRAEVPDAVVEDGDHR
jgi:hypothetical protein